MKRREFIKTATATTVLVESGLSPLLAAPAEHKNIFVPADEAFLDELQRAGFAYFWECADEKSGLIPDRAHAAGGDRRDVASIAATGFGLTALCIGARRGWKSAEAVRARVKTTLQFLRDVMPHKNGFYFHFVSAQSGERVWKSEVSTIDTAILLCGVLACRGYFKDDAEIGQLASDIYARVDWPWLTDGQLIRHGWKPESGFLRYHWGVYSEHMMLYLLAISAPQKPIAIEAWKAWRRPLFHYEGYSYIEAGAPLFVHQYSHAWFDFRGLHDPYANYFENSITATKAHRRFCEKLGERFSHFGEDLWGITASDSARGYTAWGGPPEQGKLDGTLVPCAPAGSLPFLPQECVRCLRTMREKYPRAWLHYGFVDAFNPATGWYDADVIGIDVGITLLMAENARSGFVWEIFMSNPEMRVAMTKAGFKTV